LKVVDCFISWIIMSSLSKSRQSFTFICLFLKFCCISEAQQKNNDYTKRVKDFDGKINSSSQKFSTFNRLSPSSSRRISVEEWPSHYSPFGGKRFPMKNSKIWGSERISSTRLEVKTPLNDKLADENYQRRSAQDVGSSNPASNAVEYRDAYYARLNDRVDEWMDKVNNMSLQDINRYQFRRDRPTEPGFPVQRAGSTENPKDISDASLHKAGLKPLNQSDPNYWMGPKRLKSSSIDVKAVPQTRPSADPFSPTGKKKMNFSPRAQPLLGPKKIRVELGEAQ